MNTFEPTVSATNLDRPLNRRHLLKMIGIGTAALAVGAAGVADRADARSTDSLIVNTEGARLRSGPGTSSSIVASLGRGTEVRFLADGGTANGYRWYKVRALATGKEGFIASTLLSAPGSTGSTPVISGEGWTIDSVNLRSGPSTGHQVLRVVPSDARIGISTTVQNGFRYVSYSGQPGWMADAYISLTNGGPGNGPVPNYHIATVNLNLRAEPSTSAKVLLVIPAGAKVTPHGLASNGFAKVTYNGTVGWASLTYLK